ncbi:t-SNARE affecting a late Golgi compartment protein [Lachnellula occidentalis]|uniref:t-SNARE affecting a late Golgi compartment protein 1 n=1 Tax=Lachnellula occidentalis TaxID=215460 RepID=A0A8H8S2I2_9HELO|nr:t-SNARE affecting a late Golgi compartment protein [Lachnellula occidentalis]
MMSSTNEEDPFLQVQADVLTQLRATRPLFTSYLRIRSLSTTSTTVSPELASARTDLESSLSALADDLADLIESVKAVQSDPYKYGLEIEEVSRRQRLCEEVGGEVEDMKEELSKNAHNANKNGVMFDAELETEGADNYAEFEQQQQVHMMAEQDTQLDSVFHTVGNLRQQASDMGRELEEQAEILDTTDVLADRVGGRLGTGMKKINEVVKRNEDGLSSCCIGVLIFVLILLLVLVLVL